MGRRRSQSGGQADECIVVQVVDGGGITFSRTHILGECRLSESVCLVYSMDLPGWVWTFVSSIAGSSFSHRRRRHPRQESGGTTGTFISYVVFDAKREFLIISHFHVSTTSKEYHSIAYSCHKEIVKKSTLEYKLDCTKTRTPTLEHRYIELESKNNSRCTRKIQLYKCRVLRVIKMHT